MIAPIPVVAVEQLDHPAFSVQESVIAGCQEALGPGTCVEASNQSATQLSIIPFGAWMYWDSNYRSVRVVVRSAQSSEERQLEFRMEDGLAERGEAAGLVMATVITQLRMTPKQPESSDLTSTPESDVGPRPTEPDGSGAWRLDALGLVGPSLESGPLQWGGAVRISHLGRFGPFFPLVGGAWSRSGGEISTKAYRGWLGVGSQLKLDAAFTLEASAGGMVESLELSTSDDQQTDSATRTLWGGIGEMTAVWEATGWMHAVLGGYAGATWPRVEVMRAAAGADERNHQFWGAYLGLRLPL